MERDRGSFLFVWVLIAGCVLVFALGSLQHSHLVQKRLEEENQRLRQQIARLNNVITHLESKVVEKNEVIESLVDEKESLLRAETMEGWRSQIFEVTAYSPYDDRTGLNYEGSPSSTATGSIPGPGTIAADPNIIPYGTLVVILYQGGDVEVGVVRDTGGMLRGRNRIDVFRWTHEEAMRHGIKHARVFWWEATE